MYSLYKTIYLDTHEKIYKTIFTCESYPNKLKTILQKVKLETISPFMSKNYECVYAYKSLKDTTKLMEIEELPDLLAYLISNGYQINYEITDLIASHRSNKKSIFVLMYY